MKLLSNKVRFHMRPNLSLTARLGSSVSSTDRPNASKEEVSRSEKPDWIPFSRPKYGNFTQEMPKLENQFVGDAFLQKYLRRVLPKEVIIR